MQLITNDLIQQLSVTSGIEGLKQDIELLTQFVAHANGVGLESLDTPTGKLIESGLAARYPDHFKTGTGLEGIGNLIDTLKKGLAGFKKMGRGNLKPIITKTTKSVLDEVKKTYANQSWIDDRTEKTGMVKVGAITTFTGSSDDLAGLLKGALDFFANLDGAVEKAASETATIWGKIDGALSKAKEAGDDEAKQDELLKKLESLVPEKPNKTITSEFPKMDVHDNGGKLPALSKTEVKQVGDIIVKLTKGIYEIANRAEESRLHCGFDDDDFDAAPDGKVKTFIRGFGHWEDLNNNVSELAEKAGVELLKLAQAFEAYILASVK